ncbi:MAG: hypothetical protein NC453_27210 [Muribaculum sp.]|nr:hypothetical protein [Muribaculum sp.]
MFDTNANNVYGGYVYNPTGQMQTKQSSTLTQDEYTRLMKKDNGFSLALTETDVLRGVCNHRTMDGMQDTLAQEPDGSVRCQVCGYSFRPMDAATTQEDVKEACALVIDILQTIKLLYIDMPVNTQREFFQIIPLIEKVPQLFELAVKNFSKHENYGAWNYRGQNMSAMNLFSMLSGALNAGAPMMGQPMMGGMGMGMPMGQPMGMGAPMMGNPAFQMDPNAAMSNGFGFVGQGAPMGAGYTAQTQGYQYAPTQGAPAGQQAVQMPTPPVQPGTQAPVATTAQTDGQTVNAQSTFKA